MTKPNRRPSQALKQLLHMLPDLISEVEDLENGSRGPNNSDAGALAHRIDMKIDPGLRSLADLAVALGLARTGPDHDLLRKAAAQLVRRGRATWAHRRSAIVLRKRRWQPNDETPAPPTITIPPELFSDLADMARPWRTVALKYATRILRVIKRVIAEEGVFYAALMIDHVPLAPTDNEEDETFNADMRCDAMGRLREEGFIEVRPAPPPNEEYEAVYLTGKEWPLPDEFDDMGEVESGDTDDVDDDEDTDEDADDEE